MTLLRHLAVAVVVGVVIVILSVRLNAFRDYSSGKDDLATYEFNTRVAKHMFCKTCGIHAFYVPRSDPDKIDVNARCIDDIDLAALSLKYFDGKNWEQAMGQTVPWR